MHISTTDAVDQKVGKMMEIRPWNLPGNDFNVPPWVVGPLPTSVVPCKSRYVLGVDYISTTNKPHLDRHSWRSEDHADLGDFYDIFVVQREKRCRYCSPDSFWYTHIMIEVLLIET